MNYIYTRSNPPCPWCVRVKKLLDLYNIKYEEYDVTDEEHYTYFVYQGFTSIPQVFLNNELIGGYEATEKHLRGN